LWENRQLYIVFVHGSLLKMTVSVVLASLRGSTYNSEYASPLRSLRPCRRPF
jgi:hypothetical protein